MTINNLAAHLQALEDSMCAVEALHANDLREVDANQWPAARNLLHYLALRSVDICGLQDQLHSAGLSSLASADSHIRSQVQAVRRLLGHSYQPTDVETHHIGDSRTRLEQNVAALFGTVGTAIMVTFSRQLVSEPGHLKKLLGASKNP
jgi:pyruvate kinase